MRDALSAVFSDLISAVREWWRAIGDLAQAILILAFALLLLYALDKLLTPKSKSEPPICPYCADNYEILCKRPQISPHEYRQAVVCPVCGKKLSVPSEHNDG